MFDTAHVYQLQYRASLLVHHRDMQLLCPKRNPNMFRAIRRLFYFGIEEFVLQQNRE